MKEKISVKRKSNDHYLNRRCIFCKKKFRALIYNIKKGYGIFCSHSCVCKSKTGKNAMHWKGGKKKRHCLVCCKIFFVDPGVVHDGNGIYCSRSCLGKQTIKIKKPWIYCKKGSECYQWKGNSVGYGAAHDRVKKYRGTPKKCEICGTTKAKRFEWASLTKKYWDSNDYVRLCCSCHRKKDKTFLNWKRTKNGKS